jgi:hypothetical protein
MKKNLLFCLKTFTIAIILIGILGFGCYLTKQSDSILFYVGLTTITAECFLIGWFVIKTLKSIFLADYEKTD